MPHRSVSGPTASGISMLATPLNVSLAPMARPRSPDVVVSASRAVADTFTQDHPAPTKNPPIAMTHYTGVATINKDPNPPVTSPANITGLRPQRSAALPSGKERANMPTTWTDTARDIAGNVCPW